MMGMAARAFATLAGLVLLGVTGSPTPPFAFSDVRLGGDVSTLIAAHGSPSVVTTDVGHVWTWERPDSPKIRLTADDAGKVQIIDVVPKAPVEFTVPSADPKERLPLALDALTLDAADASALAHMEDARGTAAFPDSGAQAQFRAYRLAGGTELVLLFGSARNTLGEAFYGTRDALGRGGLLPAGSYAPQPHYTAPAVVHLGAFDYPKTRHQGDAFVKIAVRKDGTVAGATIYASSGSSDLDAIALLAAKQDTFVPAKLDGEPVDSVYFHKEEFRTLPPLH